MKTLLYQDATVDISLERFIEQLSKLIPTESFATGKARFEVPARMINHPSAYNELPTRLVAEIEDAGADLTILVTAKPYDNNFFWMMQGDTMILSFYAWDRLTNLPIENGLAYFWATKALDHLSPHLNHDVNIG